MAEERLNQTPQKPQKRNDMSDMVHRIKEQVRSGHQPSKDKPRGN